MSDRFCAICRLNRPAYENCACAWERAKDGTHWLGVLGAALAGPAATERAWSIACEEHEESRQTGDWQVGHAVTCDRIRGVEDEF